MESEDGIVVFATFLISFLVGALLMWIIAQKAIAGGEKLQFGDKAYVCQQVEAKVWVETKKS